MAAQPVPARSRRAPALADDHAVAESAEITGLKPRAVCVRIAKMRAKLYIDVRCCQIAPSTSRSHSDPAFGSFECNGLVGDD